MGGLHEAFGVGMYLGPKWKHEIVKGPGALTETLRQNKQSLANGEFGGEQWLSVIYTEY